MRRNFAAVLKDAKINIKDEYSRLYAIFYDKYLTDNGSNFSIYDLIEASFSSFWFRGTCVSLEDFNETYDFFFEEQPQNFNIDYLVSFCEYVYNLTMGYMNCNNAYGSFFNVQKILEQVSRVIDKIGYMQSSEEGLIIFVEKNQAAISVAEIVPKEISYKMISYNHHTYRGDLENKRETLVKLAYYLEPKESVLSGMDNQFKNDLFYLFNNLGLRHNNLDSEGKKYKEFVAKMSREELEHWYDEM